MILGLAFLLSLPLRAQERSNPLIPDYGGVWSLPQTVKPDPNIEYRLVIDMKVRPANPEQINEGLNRIARLMNLLSLGGVKKDQIKIAAAIHGGATTAILDNEKYQEIHQLDNPNLEIIRQLKAAGVDLYVCGQSLKARGYPAENVHPEIKIGLSMLTVVSEHMMKGYSQMVFE